MTAPSRTRRFIHTRSSRGAVIPLVALALSALMAGTAFSVDLGRLRAARRDLQADADFLALDAASVLDGVTVEEALPLVVDEANASATRNQYDFETVTVDHVELGLWQTNTFVPMTGSQIPNAVRLTLTDSVPMYFDFSEAERFVTRTAVGVADFLPDVCVPPVPLACTPPEGTELKAPASRAELGSVLARLDLYQQPGVDAAVNEAIELQATFMNHIWTKFLNINVSGGVNFGAGVTGDPDPVTGPATGLRLDAVSYKGLADGVLTVEDIAQQMAADGTLAVGTVDALLSSTVVVQDFLEAAATVLSNGPRAADIDAGAIVLGIAQATDSTLTMEFGDYMVASTTSTGRAGALETWLNADDMLLAVVSIINGRNFVDATIPVDLPGVPSTVLARVTVIEPPQTHQGYRESGFYGPSTAQIKVELNVPIPSLRLDLTVLDPLLGIITRAGNIPLVMETAKSESFYDAMACPSETGTSWTDLQVENGGVQMSLDADNAAVVSLANSLGLPTTSMVNGSALVNLNLVNLLAMTNMDFHRTWSNGAQYAGELDANTSVLSNIDTLRHVAPYMSEWLEYPSADPQAASLDATFADVQFNSTVLGVTQNSTLRSKVIDGFQPVMDQIDAALNDPLLQSMGVTLAGADARVQNLLCETVFLA